MSDTADAIVRMQEAHQRITDQLGRVIVGQTEVVDEVMMAIFAKGHCLLVGVPGLAKTLLIASLSKCMDLSYKRIQFTPDLMPSDITGTEILQDDPESGKRRFQYQRGPIFANIVLADEINRTPPKTQAALLEAMQERQVSAAGKNLPLPDPFFVLATQNPIEQEGTYPLPEAQLDRFLFNIVVGYPTEDEEIEIMRRFTSSESQELEPVLHRDDIILCQKLVRAIPVADHIFQYVAKMVRATRPGEDGALEMSQELLSYGAGPRASLNLILAGKARAVLHGRNHVSIADIQAVAKPILRHRIVPNFAALSEGLDSDRIIDRLLMELPADEQMYSGSRA
ncbi:MAG: AAA family ATPase [Planctomycetota bacterium]